MSIPEQIEPPTLITIPFPISITKYNCLIHNSTKPKGITMPKNENSALMSGQIPGLTHNKKNKPKNFPSPVSFYILCMQSDHF